MPKKSQRKKGWAKAVPRKKYPYKGEVFASKAERTFAISLTNQRVLWLYEPEKIEWFPAPPKIRTYTPDFKVMRKDGSYFFVEYKGYLRPGDKTKMRAVKKQHPEIDLRFVFQNAYKYASKHTRKDGTRQTYAQWAESYGYLWAHQVIPDEWLNEKGDC